MGQGGEEIYDFLSHLPGFRNRKRPYICLESIKNLWNCFFFGFVLFFHIPASIMRLQVSYPNSLCLSFSHF